MGKVKASSSRGRRIKRFERAFGIEHRAIAAQVQIPYIVHIDLNIGFFQAQIFEGLIISRFTVSRLAIFVLGPFV